MIPTVGVALASLTTFVEQHGHAAASAFSRNGLYAAGGAILLSGIGFLVVRRLEKRVLDDE